MEPNEYQKLAERTECDQRESVRRVSRSPMAYTEEERLKSIRLLHSVVGLSGEVGEMAATVERWVYYGQRLDEANLKEEIGDCFWYLALACNALKLDMGQVMEANIRKLRTRYPERYTDKDAREENRDRGAEMEQVEDPVPSDQHPPMEQNGHGWAEPPEDYDQRGEA